LRKDGSDLRMSSHGQLGDAPTKQPLKKPTSNGICNCNVSPLNAAL
jgi:hypothetical protein